MVWDSASEEESRYLAANSYLPIYSSMRKGEICMRVSVPSGDSGRPEPNGAAGGRLPGNGCKSEGGEGMILAPKCPWKPSHPEGQKMAHRFTLGVEEEFQIIDPDTLELRSHVVQLLSAAARGLGDQVKGEMHQSIVE